MCDVFLCMRDMLCICDTLCMCDMYGPLLSGSDDHVLPAPLTQDVGQDMARPDTQDMALLETQDMAFLETHGVALLSAGPRQLHLDLQQQSKKFQLFLCF